jgi:hypothetical protein
MVTLLMKLKDCRHDPGYDTEWDDDACDDRGPTNCGMAASITNVAVRELGLTACIPATAMIKALDAMLDVRSGCRF